MLKLLHYKFVNSVQVVHDVYTSRERMYLIDAFKVDII